VSKTSFKKHGFVANNAMACDDVWTVVLHKLYHMNVSGFCLLNIHMLS